MKNGKRLLAFVLTFLMIFTNVDITALAMEHVNMTAVESVSDGDPFGVSGNDVSVSDNNATVSDGDSTVTDGDATVSGGDSMVSGGDATVSDGDSTVTDGDVTVSDGDDTVSDGDFIVGEATVSGGNFDMPGGAAVTVYGYFENDYKSMEYASFDDAVNSLTKDFNKKGNYTFSLGKDCVLTKNVTLPAFVEWLSIEGDLPMEDVNGDGISELLVQPHTLDLQGHTFTANIINLNATVQVISSTETKGKLRGTTSKDYYSAIIVEGIPSEEHLYFEKDGEWVPFGDGTGYDAVIVDHVDLDAGKGEMQLSGGGYQWSDGDYRTWYATYRINGNLSSSCLNINRCNWKVKDVVSTTDRTGYSLLYLWENPSLEADNISLICTKASTYGYSVWGNMTVKDTLKLTNYSLYLNSYYEEGEELPHYAYDFGKVESATNSRIDVVDGNTLKIGTVSMPKGTIINQGGDIAIDTVNMSNGTIEHQGGNLHIGTIKDLKTIANHDWNDCGARTTIDKAEHISMAEFWEPAYVKELGSVDTLYVYSLLLCDTVKLKKDDKAYVYGNLALNGQAEFHNVLAPNYSYVYLAPTAELAFNSSPNIPREEGSTDKTLHIGRVKMAAGFNFALAEDGELIAVNGDETQYFKWLPEDELDGSEYLNFGAEEIVFKTDIPDVDLEAIGLSSKNWSGEYTIPYQEGNEVKAGKYWIQLYSVTPDGAREDWLANFTKWSQVEAYLKANGNTNMDYVVEFYKDREITNPGAIPVNVKSLTLRGRGNENGDRVSLSFVSDLKFPSNTVLEEIDLKGDGNITSAGILTLESVTLDTTKTITLNNVLTESAYNFLSYDSLRITGTVYSESMNKRVPVTIDETGYVSTTGNGDDWIRESALVLVTKEDVKQGDLLLVADRAPEEWFIARKGSNGDYYSTYKEKNEIRFGVRNAAHGIEVYRYLNADKKDYELIGEYTVIEDAFAAIEGLNDTKSCYLVLLNPNDTMEYGNSQTNIVFPSKAADLTIKSTREIDFLYKDTLILKTDLTLEEVGLRPLAKETSINMGVYDLTILGGTLKDAQWKDITAKNSELTLKDVFPFSAIGNVSGIKTLTLKGSELDLLGKATIGDVVVPSGSLGILYGNGALDAEPNITITGKMTGNFIVGRCDYKDGKLTGEHFNAEPAENETVEYRIFKAPNAEPGEAHFQVASENAPQQTDASRNDIFVKNGAYLSYIKTYRQPVTLEFMEKETNFTKTVPFMNYEAAVQFINARKTGQEYTMTLGGVETIDLTKIAKGAVGTLCLQDCGEISEDRVYPLAKASQNCNLELDNIAFALASDKDGVEVKDPIKWTTNGYDLTIDGEVCILAPVSFDGGKKGTLTIDESAKFETITNGRTLSNFANLSMGVTRIVGSVKNFAEVNFPANVSIEQNMYCTAKENPQIEDYKILDSDFQATTLHLEGNLSVDGKFNAVNVNATGTKEPKIMVLRDFNITGSLKNDAETNLTLITKQKKNTNIPYLNISGKVEVQKSVKVSVCRGDDDTFTTVVLKNGDPLLVTKNGTIDDFLPEATSVGMKSPFTSSGTGYILAKKGGNICVYYDDEVAVGLYEEQTAELFGYYTSLEEAVNVINQRNDKNMSYAIQLIGDLGSPEAPVKFTLPASGKAARTSIHGNINGTSKIYYLNDISLNMDGKINFVTLMPMKKSGKAYVGTALGLNAGNYQLELTDVWVGSEPGMAIKSLAGKEVVLGETMKVGTVKVTTLTLKGETVLDVDGAITVTDIITDAEHPAILFGRTKDKTNLTINGDVDGNLDLKMRLPSGKTYADYVVDFEPNLAYQKVVLPEAKKLLNGPKLTHINENGTVSFFVDNEVGVPTNYQEKFFKAEKGFYIDSEAVYKFNITFGITYEETNEKSYVRCLDFAQAIKEIEYRNDKEPVYSLSAQYELPDINLTDAAKYSPLTLPGVNKAARVIISGIKSKFTGDVKVNGFVIFTDCDLQSVKSAFDDTPKPCAIIMKDSKLADGRVSRLHLSESGLGAVNPENAGNRILSKISGVKGISRIEIKNYYTPEEITVGGIMSGVNYLRLNGELTLNGKSEITNLEFTNSSLLRVYAPTSIAKFDCSSGSFDKGAVVEVLLDAKGNPMFTVTDEIYDNRPENRKKVAVRIANLSNPEDAALYIGAKLMKAPKAVADRVVAAPFIPFYTSGSTVTEIGGIQKENLMSYKDMSGYIINGDKTQMNVKVVQTIPCWPATKISYETYAASYADAKKMIDMTNNMNAEYTIMLLNKTPEVGLGADGAVVKIEFPTKAASVTICDYPDDKIATTLQYTGTMKPAVPVIFKDIILKEMNNGKATESITADLSNANGALSFADGAASYTTDAAQTDKVVFAKVTDGKGDLTLDCGKASVKGDLIVDKLEGASVITVGGKCTVNELYNIGNIDLSADDMMTITDISNRDKRANDITLRPAYTRKPWQTATSQCSIKGDFDYVVNGSIDIRPRVYENGAYREMNQNEIEDSKVAIGETPKAYKKLLDLKQVGTIKIDVLGHNCYDTVYNLSTVKYNGGVYFADAESGVVELSRYSMSEGGISYVGGSFFLDWNSAVKEIETLNDKNAYYDIEIYNTLGMKNNQNGDPEVYYTSLSMPSKAKFVSVRGDGYSDDEGKFQPAIVFFGNKVTLKCDMEFDGVWFNAMKKMKSTYTYNGHKYTSYWNYNIDCNVACGNYNLGIYDVDGSWSLADGNEEHIIDRGNVSPTNFSGSAKSTLYLEDIDSYEMLNKVSGFGTVDMETNDYNLYLHQYGSVSGVTNFNVGKNITYVADNNFSVKNLSVDKYASVRATNVTVSGTTTLNGGTVNAYAYGSKGGALKLNNVVLANSNGYSSTLQAQVDAKHKSQITIGGTITAAEGYDLKPDSLRIALSRRIGSSMERLYDGMVLMTAKKADISGVSPMYSDNRDGMGSVAAGYGLVKNPKTGAVTYTKLP